MIDRQGLLAIESDVDKSHISLWQPETVDFLILTHKIGPFYPERKLLCRMAFNPDNRIVFGINVVLNWTNGVNYNLVAMVLFRGNSNT